MNRDAGIWLKILRGSNKSDERVQCPDCEDWHVVDSLTPLLVDGQLTGRKVCTVCWEYDSVESLPAYLGFGGKHYE